MPNRPVLKLTLDTCCINLRKKDWALNELERLEEQGIIHIAATPEMLVDLERDKSPHAKRKEKAKRLHEQIHDEAAKPAPPGSFEKVLEDPNKRKKFEREIMRWLDTLFDSGPPDENMVDDIIHVFIHRAYERDIFVTFDNDLLRRREQLLKLGVTVCRPEEALRRVRDRIPSSPCS